MRKSTTNATINEYSIAVQMQYLIDDDVLRNMAGSGSAQLHKISQCLSVPARHTINDYYVYPLCKTCCHEKLR